jgi:small-conductance mechanosensitive channel
MQLPQSIISPAIINVSRLYTHYELIGNSAATALLITAACLIYRWYRRTLSSDMSDDERRRRTAQLRNRMSLVTLSALYLLWATEIQTLTVSMGALAVAFVIAAKDVVLAILGGVVRITTRRFEVGDRVLVKGARGDVLETTLLYTKLLELSSGYCSNQYTGSTLVIPNSVLITDTVTIERIRSKDIVLNRLKLPVYPHGSDIAAAANSLILAANQACNPYITCKQAQEYLSVQPQHIKASIAAANPSVAISVDTNAQWWLELQCIVPLNEQLQIEQEITTAYLELQKNLTSTN